MRYLAEHSLEHPRAHLKEYQIATEVLGRSPNFDPHSDSSVRVQMGRLRAKLAEYYSSEGLQDPILIDIPKRRYTVSFQARQVSAPSAIQLVTVPVPSPAESVSASPWRGKPALVAIVASLVATAMILLVAFRHPHVVASVLAKRKAPQQPPTALEILWAPFVHGSSEPFVVFRNSIFVGDSATGMRRFDPARDNPKQEVQHYTGIGEVMGMLALDQLFEKFGGRFRVKRGSLFTVDDARDSTLIFVGSPATSLGLSEIPSTREFTFRQLSDGSHRNRVAIVDKHPPSNAKALYAGNSRAHSGEVEYALIGLERGLDPSHWTLFLEGTSTVATEAAVDYVCNEISVSDLLQRLHVKGTADLKPFEGLIKVEVANDVPLESQLLEVRPADNQN
jgi:hypothetical protein